MTTQGYVTIAMGAISYVDMAAHLALSVRINDPSRDIALLTDERTPISDGVAALFSHVIRMPPSAGYEGCLNKLRLAEFTPYDESFFIDADSLVVKADMDRHWQRFSPHDINLAGDKVSHGEWYAFKIEDAIRELRVPWMVKMNSGVIYFRRNDAARRFFALCMELVETRATLLACTHRRAGQIADEPFIGAALGILGIEPVGYHAEDGSIMVTTVAARRCAFDAVDHVSALQKPGRHRLLGRLLPTDWVDHSPSIAHFVMLRPPAIYQRACSRLREHAGLDAAFADA